MKSTTLWVRASKSNQMSGTKYSKTNRLQNTIEYKTSTIYFELKYLNYIITNIYDRINTNNKFLHS